MQPPHVRAVAERCDLTDSVVVFSALLFVGIRGYEACYTWGFCPTSHLKVTGDRPSDYTNSLLQMTAVADDLIHASAVWLLLPP